MDAAFWHERWSANEIGFHQEQVNPLLKAYFERLALAKGARVFIPLCGKTNDIGWLLANGYAVVGAELSEMAVQALFEDLAISPVVDELADLRHYHAENIDIFVGDIFALSSELLGEVDAIYDRAALVALPAEMRKSYSQHVVAIAQGAPQLVICFEYDQALQAGPPFSISEAEIRQHYAENYQLERVITLELEGGLKGAVEANEVVWLLKKG